MNGAELPNGSILQVEPAESNQAAVKTATTKSTTHVVPNKSGNNLSLENHQANVITQSQEMGSNNESKDLEDFFASL
jgi:hypothetical protein